MISDLLQAWAVDFDLKLAALLGWRDDVPTELSDAVRYCVLAPGKRLRPFLVWRWCELAGGSADEALPPAAAVECVHAFSLVHDDLPAMDDDAVRRGRPTCHKRFGEATAILAGDALLTLAFELIARHTADPQRASAMVLELADGAGWSGMIGGQVADIQGEREPSSRAKTEYIHLHKTARLFQAACRLGALAAGADGRLLAAAGDYGLNLGRAFQIADDLLDVSATTEQMGKAVGKDDGAGKQAFPAAIGVEASRQAAERACADAVAALEGVAVDSEDLRSLAKFAIHRQH